MTPEALGLTSEDALRRRVEFGPNAVVPVEERTGPWAAIRRIVTDPMALLLAVAAATYFALGETEDAIIAVVALVPVIGVSVVLDLRAEHALESLRQLTAAGRDANGRPIFKGERTKVTIQDVIAVEGPRQPDVDHSQKKFNTGMVIIVEHGKTPSRELIDRTNGIAARWIDYWATTTGHRASMTVSVK